MPDYKQYTVAPDKRDNVVRNLRSMTCVGAFPSGTGVTAFLTTPMYVREGQQVEGSKTQSDSATWAAIETIVSTT